MTTTSQGKQTEVQIDKLSPQQLEQYSKVFEQEIGQLTQSYTQLVTATKKFQESKTVIDTMGNKGRDRDVLVPLTSSLYVPGKLDSEEKVIVEVGAGYFLEQSYDKAKEYADRKIKML